MTGVSDWTACVNSAFSVFEGSDLHFASMNHDQDIFETIDLSRRLNRNLLKLRTRLNRGHRSDRQAFRKDAILPEV